jgi:hypothetical protein
MSTDTDITKDLIERFSTDIVEPSLARKESVPINQRPGNAQYRKIAQQVELLQQVKSEFERSRQLNLDFLAMAETICNKIEKYRIGEKDVLMPSQKKELAWIKEQMQKIKNNEDYKI